MSTPMEAIKMEGQEEHASRESIDVMMRYINGKKEKTANEMLALAIYEKAKDFPHMNGGVFGSAIMACGREYTDIAKMYEHIEKLLELEGHEIGPAEPEGTKGGEFRKY